MAVYKNDRLEKVRFWEKMKRNIVKVWRVIYVPMRTFFVGEGAKEKNEEIEKENNPIPEEKSPYDDGRNYVDVGGDPDALEEDSSFDDYPEDEGLDDGYLEYEEETGGGSEEEGVIDDEYLINPDDQARANEILARLEKEAAEDEAIKEAEIEAARQFAENSQNSSFNKTTGSFSGDYGTGPVDDDTMDAVKELLKQNNRSGIDF